MAKLLKFFLFVLLLGFLAYIFVYIGELDDKPEETEITDVDVVKAYGDSLAQIAVDDTVSKTRASELTSAFEDFTVTVDAELMKNSLLLSAALKLKPADLDSITKPPEICIQAVPFQ